MDTVSGSSPFQSGLRETLPALVLMVTAAGFAIAVHHHHLSTWIGPGFSMFAGVDYHGTRAVQVEVTTSGGTAAAVLPEDLKPWAKRQRIRPDQGLLEDAAERLASMTWTRNADGVFEVAADGEAGQPAQRAVVRLVTVQVAGDTISVNALLEASVP